MAEKIKVPAQVLEGLKFVRNSGKTNMFDYNEVLTIAFNNHHYATVNWMQKNKELYAKGLFKGFEIE